METQAQKINTVWEELQAEEGGGVGCRYRNGIVSGNMDTLAVDNVK